MSITSHPYFSTRILLLFHAIYHDGYSLLPCTVISLRHYFMSVLKACDYQKRY